MGQAIGIDFGTTNTVVSYKNKAGHYEPLKYKDKNLIPSIIFFKTKEDYTIGYAAKNLGLTNPAAQVKNFKTMLGDSKFSYNVTALNGETFKLNPRKAVNLFLNKVIEAAKEKLRKDFGTDDGEIDRAVITVPAKFNPQEIGAIKSAASKALNLDKENIRLVYEPTAAAFAAQKDEGSSADKVLIYDLGGGTFDVSLIRRDSERNKFVPVSTADGDKHLGGNLFTDLLADKLMQWANEEYGTEFTTNINDYDADEHEITREKYMLNIARIKTAAEEIKEELSDSDEVDKDFNFFTDDENSEVMDITVTRKEFEKLIKKYVTETVNITYNTIHSPEAEALGEIDRIVLAGGSSKIPLIHEMLTEKLKRDDIIYSEEVYSLISRGAAILAQNISQSDEDVEQVTNFQIGIAATSGMLFGKFEKIISENIKLPCSASKDFTLAYDGQTRLDIAYYEYDVKKYPNSTCIDQDGFQEIDVLHIDLPQNLRKNNTVIRVTFNANADGSMDLTAQILDSNGNKIKDDDILNVSKESDLI